MPCYMPRYELGKLQEKLCKSGCISSQILGPVVGGGRVAGSAMHLLLIRCCGQTVVLRAAAR